MKARTRHLTTDTPYTAIGLEQDGMIIAGVLYDNFTRVNIDAHIAGEGRRWMTKRFLGEMFRYPFVQLGVARITCRIAASNADSLRLCQHMGFTWEGRIREALPDGEDLLILGMLRRECRWLGVGLNG